MLNELLSFGFPTSKFKTEDVPVTATLQPQIKFPMFAKSNRPTSKLTFRILDLLEHPGEYVLLLVRSNHDSYLLGVI